MDQKDYRKAQSQQSRSIDQGNKMAGLVAHPDWDFYAKYLEASIEQLRRDLESKSFMFKRVPMDDGNGGISYVTEPLAADQIAIKMAHLTGELRGIQKALTTPERFIKEKERVLKTQAKEQDGTRTT